MDQKALDAMQNEITVIGKILDVLKYSTFSGHMAQDVAISQMYLKGLYDHMKANHAKESEALKSAPVETPAEVIAK